ncbi:MAG TPA: hypothetical protein VHZ30_07890 [Verrucomicrobiae bacterium]|jgi:hypothetical protein|nr:hypothetical protein [Verrucomicrobiae bacterium]
MMNPDNQSPATGTAQISVASDYHEAQIAANLCREWHRLKTEGHLSGNQAAASLGKSPSWFSINFPRWQRGGVAAFLPERRELGAARRLFTDLPAWFMAVARFFLPQYQFHEFARKHPGINPPRD